MTDAIGRGAGLMAVLMVNQNKAAQRIQYADLRSLLNSINAKLS
jgi:hypothetical protein